MKAKFRMFSVYYFMLIFLGLNSATVWSAETQTAPKSDTKSHFDNSGSLGGTYQTSKMMTWRTDFRFKLPSVWSLGVGADGSHANATATTSSSDRWGFYGRPEVKLNETFSARFGGDWRHESGKVTSAGILLGGTVVVSDAWKGDLLTLVFLDVRAGRLHRKAGVLISAQNLRSLYLGGRIEQDLPWDFVVYAGGSKTFYENSPRGILTRISPLLTRTQGSSGLIYDLIDWSWKLGLESHWIEEWTVGVEVSQASSAADGANSTTCEALGSWQMTDRLAIDLEGGFSKGNGTTEMLVGGGVKVGF